MALYLFLVAGLLTFLSIQYLLIPRLEVKDARGRKPLKRSVALAVCKYLSATALIATLTYALILGVIFGLGLTRPVTSRELGAVIARVQSFQSDYKIFREFWTFWLFLMLLLAVIAYRREKKATGAAAPPARAAAAPEPPPPLSPSEEMQSITRQIQECVRKAKRMEEGWVRTDEELVRRKLDLALEADRLRRELQEADARRRAQPAPASEQQPPPVGAFPRLRRFLSSKGFVKTLESTTRSLGYVGTALLVLCVIGVNVPVLDRALADRVVRWTELQVEATKEEARQSYEKVMAEEADGGAQQLTPEEVRDLEEVAHLFEKAFTSSRIWQADDKAEAEENKDERDDAAAERDKEEDKQKFIYFTRSAAVRDQIVADFRRDPPGGPGKPGGSNPPDGPDNPDGPKPKDGGPRQPGPKPPKSSKPPGTGDNNGRPQPPDVNPPAPTRPLSPSTPPRAYPYNTRRASRPPDGELTGDLRARLVSADDSPQSELGAQTSKAFEHGVKGRSRLLAKFRAKLSEFKKSFNEPHDRLGVVQLALGEAVAFAVDKSWQPPNEAAGQGKKVLQTAIKDAAKGFFARAWRGDGDGQAAYEGTLKGVVQTLLSRFFSDMSGPETLGQALAHVREGAPGQAVATGDELAALREVAAKLPGEEHLFGGLSKSYTDLPPALDYDAAERAEHEAAAAGLRQTHGARSLTGEDLKLVDSYEDHYPGRRGSEGDTPEGKLLAERGRVLAHSESENLAAQARDFQKLRQSVDVGGILMGRDAESNSPGGDVRDVRWEVDGDHISLFLRSADGSEVSAGRFEKSLVYQALAYVADDRKVVVTIVSGGRGRRKVMLHPALVDTRLGRDIVEFDKLVFRFIDGDPTREQAETLVRGQTSLYNLAWNLRKLGVLRRWQGERRLTAAGEERLTNLAAWEQEVFRNQKLWESLGPALQDADGLKRADKSILAYGRAYFDPSLIDDLSGCAAKQRQDFAALHTCLSSEVARRVAVGSEDSLRAWDKPPPNPAWRSIAEELSYQLDPRLSFIKPAGDADPAERLWPFQFRYEVAFPAEAPYRTSADKTDAYRTPWEFTGLRGLIAEKVWGGVEADAELRALYGRVRDFTVLQRLFRASLSGGLGRRFPVEKLVTLARSTAGSLPTAGTARWD